MQARGKGWWGSPEGEAVIKAYVNGEIGVEKAARRAGTTVQGVYSAVSRSRRLRPVPVSTALLKKLDELAQMAVPDVIARLRERILTLEAEVQELREENAKLRGGKHP